MKKLSLFVLFLLASVTAAPAQSVVIYGKVKNLGMYVTICWHGATHGLVETNIKIKRTPINLTVLEGKVARLEGTMSPGNYNGCMHMVITKATLAPEYMTLSGTPKIGGSVNVTVYGKTGRPHYLLFSAGTPASTSLPFQTFPGTIGTLFLNIPSLEIEGFSVIPATGVWNKAVKVPNVPALIGMKYTLQDAVMEPSTAGLRPIFINPITVKIQ